MCSYVGRRWKNLVNIMGKTWTYTVNHIRDGYAVYGKNVKRPKKKILLGWLLLVPLRAVTTEVLLRASIPSNGRNAAKKTIRTHQDKSTARYRPLSCARRYTSVTTSRKFAIHAKVPSTVTKKRHVRASVEPMREYNHVAYTTKCIVVTGARVKRTRSVEIYYK